MIYSKKEISIPRTNLYKCVHSYKYSIFLFIILVNIINKYI